jgi:hypothetical protein
MTETNPGAVTECDCGYRCRGETVAEQISDGQRHAREVHGIEVTADQVLASQTGPNERGDSS